MKVTITSVAAPLRAPFESSYGALDTRKLLLLALEDSEGHVGFGEAAPLEPYDHVTIEDVRYALEECRPTLAHALWLERAEVLAQCVRLARLPQAIAAIDLALWDLAGRREGQPVWRLLGAQEPPPIEVNHTIAAADRAGAAREAAGAREAGFRCVKVKVALGDDAGRVAAVRAAAGNDMKIRLDANGGWSVPEALAALRALEPVGIELCEEPVRGLQQVASLSEQTTVPLAIDETANESDAFGRTACQAACLKLASCGGITGLLATARRARAAGYDVYLASTLDGPLGIAAALHAAAVLRPSRACGLATLGLFAGREDPLVPRAGRIEPPPGPGLGDGLVAWYRR